jgi:deazaflavin-dependent oxidoreductase (nitroreductase family)
MRRVVPAVGLIGSVAAIDEWWRQHPRIGAAYVNRVVDPWLVRQGVIAESGGELGLIEHVGRVSGTIRRTPVHPVATETGFRIVVPLGDHSEWAANVLAAGHCRLQVGPLVHELDEPALVVPTRVEDLPRELARVMEWLGFRYLLLHRYAQHEGALETPPGIVPEPEVVPEAAPVAEDVPATQPVAAG